MDIPETRYATTREGISIAYVELGDGPHNLIFTPGWVTNVEVLFEWPGVARTFFRLAERARLIVYDKQGTGLSERIATLPDLDARMDDIHAVMGAAAMDRAALLGATQGAAVSALFAASFPEKVDALITYGGFARVMWAPDYPWGQLDPEARAWQDRIRTDWGTERWALASVEEWGGEDLRHDPAFIQWMAKLMRFSATPNAAIAFDDAFGATDVRNVLPTIDTPTLLLHRADQGEADEVAYTAALIPSSTVVQLPPDHWSPYLANPEPMAQAIESFLDGADDRIIDLDRVLATVLFTDIVDSTAQGAAIGDRAWRELRERHDAVVRAELARFRGREVKTMGDGFLATFDGPARGVRCAQRIADSVRPIGIEIRAGLHTGEIALDGDDVAGLGVAIGARVGALAGPSEVLVSQTVKDLVAGSGLAFEDVGEHELKGVPERWRLYRVVA